MGQKLNFLGAVLLMGSLFLSWYSDKDVFRSGDVYTALDGPLYFVGFSMLLLCLLNLGTLIYAVWRGGVSKRWSESPLGKAQMLMGFFSMYLLIVINSVYFHPQFGLNLLSKRSEIGVMAALVATVMVCVGGYISFRKKFELPEPVMEQTKAADVITPPKKVIEQTPKAEPAPLQLRKTAVFSAPVMAAVDPAPVLAEKVVEPPPANVVPVLAQNPIYSERDTRGKTDYERSRLYENLKKTMIRDTLTPEKRRKLLAQEAKENAFSANFGKEKIISTVAARPPKTGATLETMLKKTAGAKAAAGAADSPTGEKKPQMYRMDL